MATIHFGATVAVLDLSQRANQVLAIIDMRSGISAGCSSMEKLGASQKLLAENSNQATVNAQPEIRPVRNAIRACISRPILYSILRAQG